MVEIIANQTTIDMYLYDFLIKNNITPEDFRNINIRIIRDKDSYITTIIDSN